MYMMPAKDELSLYAQLENIRTKHLDRSLVRYGHFSCYPIIRKWKFSMDLYNFTVNPPLVKYIILKYHNLANV